MAVNAVLNDVRFYNQFRNEKDFTANTGDFTRNLTGTAMEKIKLTAFIDVNWSVSVSSSDVWSLDTSAQKIQKQQGTWASEGFSIGDTCSWLQNGSGTAHIEITAFSVDGLTLYYTLVNGSLTDSNNASLVGISPLQAVIHKFGIIENSEKFNISSKVSGNDQAYYASGVGVPNGAGGRDTSFVNMTRLGAYKDWQSGSMRVRYHSNPAYDIQRFEIEHIFTIPYYVEGELSNLKNNIITNIHQGTKSLKYVSETDIRTGINNPNTGKIVKDENNLGSVAWFNESFDGFQNNYSITSLSYEEAASGNNADGILIGSKTKVKATIERVGGSFSSAERYGVYVSYLPEEHEYKNTLLTTMTENFIYDCAFNYGGLAATTGDDFITSTTASVVGGKLEIEMEMEYSALQKAFLAGKFSQSPTNFLLAFSVGDNTLSNQNSDRVTLIADARLYDQSADIPDLLIPKELRFHHHNLPITPTSGFSDLKKLYNEDGIAVAFKFELDLDKKAEIKSLDFKLVAHNDTTGVFFEMDSFSYSGIANATVSNGVQQLFQNTTRNYNLASGDQFNEVSITTGSLTSGKQEYSGVFSQKISWQEWILNSDVDTVFFNNASQNQNLNYKTSNYSSLHGYSVKLAMSATVSGVSDLGVSGITSYLVLSPELVVFDYGLDGSVTPFWSGTIETFHPLTGVNLNGKVLSGLNTLFKTTWTSSLGAVTDLSTLWNVQRIEETDQGGYFIDELSTVNPYPTPNRLIPLTGQTKTTMNIVSGTVVTECHVDGSQILQGKSYNLSSRINDDTVVELGRKVTEAGVLKITESGVQKIVE